MASRTLRFSSVVAQRVQELSKSKETPGPALCRKVLWSATGGRSQVDSQWMPVDAGGCYIHY